MLNADLVSHPITAALKQHGATDEQIATIRFRASNCGLPFDLWSVKCRGDMPENAIGLLKAYCALKWVTQEDPESSQDVDDAYKLVDEIVSAPLIPFATKYRATQSAKAKLPRGKVTEDGLNMQQIVEALRLKPENRDDTAAELWPKFFAELDTLGLDPSEDPNADRRLSRYWYDFGSGRKSLAFRSVANIISQIK